MKDKYKNSWKRSELRELVKNILIYGDKWDEISIKTGDRLTEKYKKHARRFFVRNSFILHRIYENQPANTIDNFIEFNKDMLVLNFSYMKLKYRDFSPENLRTIKINFYKNLKSLGIENSYFDEIYIQNNFQNIEEENEELFKKTKTQTFQFETRNLKSQNSESIPYEEFCEFQKLNSNNLNQNKIYSDLSYNDSIKNSEKFLECDNDNQNQTNNLFFNIDPNAEILNNSLGNRPNYNYFNTNSFSNLSSNNGNNYFKFLNNLNFSNYTKNNLTKDSDKEINNNISSKNIYDWIDKNNCSNQDANDKRFIEEKEELPRFEKSENNYINNIKENKFSLDIDNNKKSQRDYNSISNKILKKFNDAISLNLDNLEENENIKKHFLIEKYHDVEKKCKHDINLEKLVLKKQNKMKNYKKEKAIMKHKKFNEITLENFKENQKEKQDIKINEDKNIENILKNKSSLIDIEIGNEIYTENQIDLKKIKDENLISELIQDISNEFIFKNSNIQNKNIKKNSRKNSDILMHNNYLTKKKLSMDSQLTKISQDENNNNIEKNENLINKNKEEYKNNFFKVLNEEKEILEINYEVEAGKDLRQNLNSEKLINNKDYVFNQATANFPNNQNELNERKSKRINVKQKFNSNENIPNVIQGKINNYKKSTKMENVNNSEFLIKKKRLRNPKKTSNINPLQLNSYIKDPNILRKNSLKNKNNISNSKLSLKNKNLNKISHKSYNLEDNLSCYSNNFLSSIAFNDNKKFKVKRQIKNFFNSQNNFEKVLNSEVPGEYGEEAKIEVDETLSSNHSEVETSKRNLSSRINENYDLSKNQSYFNNNFNKIFNNCNSNLVYNSQNQILKKDSKTDLLELEKNSQLFQEKNKSRTKKNFIPNNYFNLSLSSYPQNSLLDKFSVLSDKNKNFGSVNLSSATIANFFSNTNNSNNILKNDSFVNNSNLESNKYNYNNSNVSHNNLINNNKFLQNTNLNDIYFSFNPKANINSNNENFINKKKTSRKNSALNKNESLSQKNNINTNKNNDINNDLNNNSEYESDVKKAIKKTSNNNFQNENDLKKNYKKINNFTIIRKVCNMNTIKENLIKDKNQSEEFYMKENNSNYLTHNISGSQEDFNNIKEKSKRKAFFMIEKISKLEKERLRELGLKEAENLEEKYNKTNELEENFTEEVSCDSYNLDFLEKVNYNDATVKALISLKKMNSKKNSIDMPVNTINNNNSSKINQTALNKNYHENNLKGEKIHLNANIENLINKLENSKNRKFISNNYKERNNFSPNESDINCTSDNDLNNEKQLEVELSKSKNIALKLGPEALYELNKSTYNLKHKNSDLNNLIRENSHKTEIARKGSFLITKETRRKETNNTITEDNLNKKLITEEIVISKNLKNTIDENDNYYMLPPKLIKEKNKNNYSDFFDDTEYVNLMPNLRYNSEMINNYSSTGEKNLIIPYNTKTSKDTVKIENDNYGLISRELDIDTIKTLKLNITKSPLKQIKQSKPHLIDCINNTNNNSQINPNFNSYIFNLDSTTKYNTNNIYNSNNFNSNNLNIHPNKIDLNVLNDLPQSFPKEKNSHFSNDNLNKECFIFSEYNDDLDCYLNSSDSEVSIKKQKMLNDKVEKLISSVLKKNNFLLNKNCNINTKLNSSNNCNSNNNINNSPNLSLINNQNNTINGNDINNNNNNKIHNNTKKEIKFKVNNLSSMQSNKNLKEKPDLTIPFNLLSNTNNNNIENFNSLGNNLNPNSSINSNSFYNGPASITTNNINNFHIINSNGPCIFPITQNITNFGKIMNHTITQSPFLINDFKIQNQNFNIITDENITNEENIKIYKIEKSSDNRKRSFKKYSDAELIETTVAKAKMNLKSCNDNDKNNKYDLYSALKNNRNKTNKKQKKIKSIKNEKFIFSSISTKNNENNLELKNNNNSLNKESYKILNNNINKHDNNTKSSILSMNNFSKSTENCLSKIENFTDFNLGNFNDCPNNIKQLNNNNYNSNYNSNNYNLYKNLRVFDDKNNFFQDKVNGKNLTSSSYLYSNTNNPMTNPGVILQNPMQIGSLDLLSENQPITNCNQNQCKDDFNNINENPFVLNFVIDEVGKENVKMDNNDNIFDMMGFN